MGAVVNVILTINVPALNIRFAVGMARSVIRH